MAQPRSQRDQSRSLASGNALVSGREPFFNDRELRTSPAAMPFIQQQPNPMAMLYQQRPMGQMPIMGAGIPMMSLNPMAMAMGMGMNGYNAMGGINGMNGMGMMGGMNGMNNVMHNMNGMGAMRLGMGPMGSTGMVGGGVNNMGMGMRPGMPPMGVGNPNFGRMAMNTGLGPSRMTSRGQHSFHPYAR